MEEEKINKLSIEDRCMPFRQIDDEKSPDEVKTLEAEILEPKIDIVKRIVETESVPTDTLEESIMEAGICLSVKGCEEIGSSALKVLGEVYSVNVISKILLSRSFIGKPSLWAESLYWVSNAIYGSIGYIHRPVDTDFFTECGEKAFCQSNDSVRHAGLALIGAAHLHVSHDHSKCVKPSVYVSKTRRNAVEKPTFVEPAVHLSMEKEKALNDDTVKCDPDDQITAQLDAAHLQVSHDRSKCVKPSVQVSKISQRTKTRRNAVEKPTLVEPADHSSIEKEKTIKDDTVTCELGDQITAQLVAGLRDVNWKLRAEAVTKFHDIVKAAGAITPNQLGEAAPRLLVARLSDHNSQIILATIALVESLAIGMGIKCKQYTLSFLPALLKLLGNQKVSIRTAVKTCINTWYDHSDHKDFFENEMIVAALRTGSATVNTEIWKFLAHRLPTMPAKTVSTSKLMGFLPFLYANMEGGSADLRKNACEAVLGFMIHLGFDEMNNACEDSKIKIKSFLVKTSGSVPEELPLPKKKPTPPRSAPALLRRFKK